jgi:hypothetical protein
MTSALVDRIAEILLRHDPVGIYFQADENIDEYVPEAKEICKRLGESGSAEACLELVYSVFLKYFGPSVVGGIDKYRPIAAEIYRLHSPTD